MDYAGEDRRSEPRIPYITEAVVEHTRRSSDRLSDLSTRGAFVETLNGLSVGSVFALVFSLPATEVRVNVEVRYNMSPIGTGVRFLDLTEADRSTIDQFVRERSA